MVARNPLLSKPSARPSHRVEERYDTVAEMGDGGGVVGTAENRLLKGAHRIVEHSLPLVEETESVPRSIVLRVESETSAIRAHRPLGVIQAGQADAHRVVDVGMVRSETCRLFALGEGFRWGVDAKEELRELKASREVVRVELQRTTIGLPRDVESASRGVEVRQHGIRVEEVGVFLDRAEGYRFRGREVPCGKVGETQKAQGVGVVGIPRDDILPRANPQRRADRRTKLLERKRGAESHFGVGVIDGTKEGQGRACVGAVAESLSGARPNGGVFIVETEKKRVERFGRGEEAEGLHDRFTASRMGMAQRGDEPLEIERSAVVERMDWWRRSLEEVAFRLHSGLSKSDGWLSFGYDEEGGAETRK